MAKAYKARWIISAATEGQNVYEDSALIVEENKIISIVPQQELEEENLEEIIDYENSIITPGFVNMGTRLEYSKIDENLEKEKTFKRFLLNIKQFFCMLGTPINTYPMKLADVYKEYKLFTKKEKIESVKMGIEQALINGITCISEISDDDSFVEILNKYPIKKYFFFDLKADSKKESKKVFFKLKKRIKKLQKNKKSSINIGLYPHSIWSVHSSLWGVISKYARKNKFPLMTELMESTDEVDFVEFGKSNLDYLNNFYGYKKIKYPKTTSPVDYLAGKKVLSENVIIQNGNFLRNEEIAILAENGVNFSYSPKLNTDLFGKTQSLPTLLKYFSEKVGLTSDYLFYKHSPIEEIKGCIGTLSIEELIQYLTIYPAKVLGLNKKTGSLEFNKDADFNVFKLDKKQKLLTDLQYIKVPSDVYVSGKCVVKNGKIL